MTPNRSPAASEWPAVVAAIAILVLLGAVLVTATVRWPASDVRDLMGALGPVIGFVVGAFLTYVFTRQTNATAIRLAYLEVASTRAGLASCREQLDAHVRNSHQC